MQRKARCSSESHRDSLGQVHHLRGHFHDVRERKVREVDILRENPETQTND